MKIEQVLGIATNDGHDSANPPHLTYMAMHTDPAGLSAMAFRELTGFSPRSLGGQAASMWMQRFAGAPTEVWFTVLPVGWVGEWHESPARQWVTALSGRWWIETADGQRLEMGPGEIHWGQDQSTIGQRGHRSGQSGDTPCVQLMIRYTGSSGCEVSWPFTVKSEATT
ncbi:cupin domain-containing protein [Azorhizobium oxalatiphilum]|nr:cupin domain-containing protein [Azorhizobium oxalatiphilum]